MQNPSIDTIIVEMNPNPDFSEDQDIYCSEILKYMYLIAVNSIYIPSSSIGSLPRSYE